MQRVHKYYMMLCLLLLPATPLLAQYNNVWAFGSKAGIDFNTQPPRAIATGIGASEGCASVCDTNGALLFYTNGYTVWNRDHNPMPNGENLPATTGGYFTSSSQGTMIAALPDNPHRYYIFSLGSFEHSYYFGRLYYSVVDMTLDNGRGDVPAAEKGIFLDSMLTEHMSGVLGDGCNLWLVVLSRAKDEIKSFRIDHKGVSPVPVLSERIRGAGALSGGIGCMDISPDRRRIAVAQGNLVVYDFDPATGMLDRPLVVDDFPAGISPGGYYGVAFSPDNSKLYANDGPFFYQFNLSLANETATRNSKTKLSETRFGNAAIQRGPDGKLYTATMSVIHQPDLAGIDCRFEDRGFQLAPGTTGSWGLPNNNALLHYEQRHSLHLDTFTCVDEAFLSPLRSGAEDYVWEDGSIGPSRSIRESGTYWVRYYDLTSGCIAYTDAFQVQLKKNVYHRTVTEKAGLCQQDTILLEAHTNLSTVYEWEDGTLGKDRYVHQAGRYRLQYRDDTACAHYSDSFIVRYPSERYRVAFTADTFACSDAPVAFRNTSHAYFQDFYWSMGDGGTSTEPDPEYRYPDAGTYSIRLAGRMNEYCYDTAHGQVIVDAREQVSFTLSRDSICQGERISIQTGKLTAGIKAMHWQWGEDMEEYRMPEEALTHAYEEAGRFPVTLTALFRACPDTTFQTPVYVAALPVVNLGTDSGLCIGGKELILQNQVGPGLERQSYLWNTGDTTAFIRVRQPGTYRLTVAAEPLGCRGTEEVVVPKNCYLDMPNAFSPNGDGVNDYFFPRQLLSDGLLAFHMQVYNRWGQMMFETHNIMGRGWNGCFNGVEQPAGVYMYRIFLDWGSTGTQAYEGNVTLLR